MNKKSPEKQVSKEEKREFSDFEHIDSDDGDLVDIKKEEAY